MFRWLSCMLRHEDFALGLKTRRRALKRAILDDWVWCRHGGRCVAICADDAAGLTGFSSGQVCLVGQAMVPAVLALLVLKGLLDSGIASHGGVSLGWQGPCLQSALVWRLLRWPCVLHRTLSRWPVRPVCGRVSLHWQGVHVFALGLGPLRHCLVRSRAIC
jgi:hypothetical protein